MTESSSISRVFLLDKAAGISSFKALGELKRRIGTKKVGHAGTLDPFATGLLIAMSGKMTKAVAMVADADKEYIASFCFGEETDTLDTEGSIVANADIPTIGDITKAISGFLGDIVQVPPAFSAIKVNGRRAYQRARRGDQVAMPERRVTIHDFEVLSWNAPILRVRIRCSKGTYIRSIARDLGIASGSRGYCSALHRSAIGPFRLPTDSEGRSKDGMSPRSFFEAMAVPVIHVKDQIARELRSGRPLDRIPAINTMADPRVLAVDDSGLEAALIELTNGRPQYRIVFD